MAAPDDFFHFDPNELEEKGQKILFPTDEWARPKNMHANRMVPMKELTTRQKAIALWWKKMEPIDLRITPFLLNWLDKRAESDFCNIEVNKALSYLVQYGSERDRELAADVVARRSDACAVGRTMSNI